VSFSSPRTWVTGELATAALLNQEIKSNIEALDAGRLAIASQATGDVFYASSSTAMTRLAASTGKYLRSGDPGPAPAWSALTNVVSKTTTASLTTSECGEFAVIKASTAGGAYTITLFAASTNAGRRLTIVKTTSDTSALTIDGNASETINGIASTLLYRQWDYITMCCDGSNWIVEDYRITVEARSKLNSPQGVATGTDVTIICGDEQIDTASAYNNSTGIFTVPARMAGTYYCCVMAQGENNSGTDSYTMLFKGGTEMARWQDKTNPGTTGMAIAKTLTLNSADTILMKYQHNRGSDTDVLTGRKTFFEVRLIRLDWET
jgi:hypothetical protein